MKETLKNIKPIPKIVAIAFTVVFFIIASHTSALAVQPMVAAGFGHTVGLKSDGTFVAVGDNGNDQLNVSTWTNIVHVAAGWAHTVGLKSDGTVVAVGANGYGQCNVGSWTDIVQVAAGSGHTLG